jgi:hypothetical protein
MSGYYDNQTPGGYGDFTGVQFSPVMSIEDDVIDQTFRPFMPIPMGDEGLSTGALFVKYGIPRAIDALGSVAVEKARRLHPDDQWMGTDGKSYTAKVNASVNRQTGAVTASGNASLILLAAAAAVLWFVLKK